MIKKYVTLFILILSLSGCFSGTTPPSKFYTLTPTQTKAVSDKRMNIGIDRIQLPRSLDRPQMLTASATTPEMTLSELNRWIEPLPTLIQRCLITDLSTALPNSVIGSKTFSGPIDDYTISVNIIRLTATPGKEVTLLAWVSIRSAQGQERQIKVSESLPVGSSYTDIANVQSILIGRLSHKIALSLIK